MLYIQDTLISLDLVEEQFICNLDACKGACCVEGDFGAPLLDEEKDVLLDIYDSIAPYLLPDAKQRMAQHGLFEYIEESGYYATSLMPDGACVFLTYQNGIAKCGIEKAYEAGATSYKKPISCHLYPIRITRNEESGFEAWNYDRWDICSAACSLGKQEQVPIYRFLKEAIIRAKGEEFYQELDAAAQHIEKDEPTA